MSFRLTVCVCNGLSPHLLSVAPDQKIVVPTLSFIFFSCVCIQMAVGMYYNVEYTIQETTCARSTEAVAAAKCPLMECEFAVSCFYHFFLIK